MSDRETKVYLLCPSCGWYSWLVNNVSDTLITKLSPRTRTVVDKDSNSRQNVSGRLLNRGWKAPGDAAVSRPGPPVEAAQDSANSASECLVEHVITATSWVSVTSSLWRVLCCVVLEREPLGQTGNCCLPRRWRAAVAPATKVIAVGLLDNWTQSRLMGFWGGWLLVTYYLFRMRGVCGGREHGSGTVATSALQQQTRHYQLYTYTVHTGFCKSRLASVFLSLVLIQ